MRTIRYTKKVRKDFKKYARNPDKVRKIREITKLLQNEDEIPSKYRPHPLIGNYAGHMELHIEGDLLLIWIEHTEVGEATITFVRLGTHAELF